jgi:hypothetical protein
MTEKARMHRANRVLIGWIGQEHARSHHIIRSAAKLFYRRKDDRAASLRLSGRIARRG